MGRKSRFTKVGATAGGGVQEDPQTLIKPLANQANPAVNPSLTVKQRGTPAATADVHPVWLYVAPSTFAYATSLRGGPWARPIRLSIFFGVGFEINRHGLRSAFENLAEPSALILVPGIEPNKRQPGRWGVAIRDVEIRDLLQTAVGRDVAYDTRVLAAFSTGINGLNQTLLNGLIGLTALRRIVVYDCLYKLSSGDTATALRAARAAAGPGVKIVVYKCTSGGNTLEPDGRLTVLAEHPELTPSDAVVQLWFEPAYAALIMFRSLEGGIADGSITLPAGSALEGAFAAMKGIVPPRGTIASRRAAHRHVFGSAPPRGGTVFYDDWARDPANVPVIRAFVRHTGSKTEADTIRNLIWANFLPGWGGGPSDGEENHDLLLPDFAWEFLPPT